RGLRERVAVAERQQRALHRLVDQPSRPHVARAELLEDVERPRRGAGLGVPPAPRAVVLVVVPAPALLEGVVARARPRELVDPLGHAPSLAGRGQTLPCHGAWARFAGVARVW